MVTQKHHSYRPIDFPDPPQPPGVEPAMVRPIIAGEPFMGDPAVGEVKTGLTDTLMLEVPEHMPGQIRSLLSLVEPDLIRRIDIHSGAISADDLAAMSGAFINEVRLGKPRVGLEPPDPIEMEFVDGASLSKLSGPRSLHVLNVPFTDKNLATVGTTSVEELFLSGMTADSSLLSRFKFLTMLFIDGCEGSEDLSFLESMPNLFAFGFRFSRLTTDQLRHVKKCTQLRVLDIAYNRDLGPDLSVLDGYPSLAFLDISTTRADDTTLASIGDHRLLEQLNAQCVDITDAGIAPLRNRSGLDHLNLAGNRITDAGLASLAGTLPRLRTLDLRDTDITIEGVVNLIPQFPEIRVLGVSGDLLNAEVADHLSRHTDIGELHICPPIERDTLIEAVDIIGAAKFNGKPV
jgi:hypothetical protein